jgi:hypothetical protein
MVVISEYRTYAYLNGVSIVFIKEYSAYVYAGEHVGTSYDIGFEKEYDGKDSESVRQYSTHIALTPIPIPGFNKDDYLLSPLRFEVRYGEVRIKFEALLLSIGTNIEHIYVPAYIHGKWATAGTAYLPSPKTLYLAPTATLI